MTVLPTRLRISIFLHTDTVLLIFENASGAADFAAQKDDGFWDFG
jgi:hypothetical protein